VEQQSKGVIGDVAAASFSETSDVRDLCKVQVLFGDYTLPSVAPWSGVSWWGAHIFCYALPNL